MTTKIRCLLAFALVVAACGDDSSDDDGSDDSTERDSGTPKGDAGESLEDALKTDGVSVSNARAEALFPAACKNNQACEADPGCVAGYRSSYQSGVTMKFDTACLDATLDLFACFAKETDCTKYETVCESFRAAQATKCAAYIDAGMMAMP